MSHEAAKNATIDDGGHYEKQTSPLQAPTNLDTGRQPPASTATQDSGVTTGAISSASPASRDPSHTSSPPGLHHQPAQHISYPESASRSSTPNPSSSKPNSPHDYLHGASSGLEGFAQPSTFLRHGRGYSRTMPQLKQEESAIDREERLGLVCDAPALKY